MKNIKLFALVGIVGFTAVAVGIVPALAVAVVSTLVAIVGGRDYQDIPTVMDNPQPYLYLGQ